ncbi:hypothetical protein ACC785_38375, partial [Rhizobium ruizarguesonis]
AHPLANRKTVRMSDCLLYPLVLADRSLSLREVVEATAPARATLVPVGGMKTRSPVAISRSTSSRLRKVM